MWVEACGDDVRQVEHVDFLPMLFMVMVCQI